MIGYDSYSVLTLLEKIIIESSVLKMSKQVQFRNWTHHCPLARNQFLVNLSTADIALHAVSNPANNFCAGTLLSVPIFTIYSSLSLSSSKKLRCIYSQPVESHMVDPFFLSFPGHSNNDNTGQQKSTFFKTRSKLLYVLVRNDILNTVLTSDCL